VEFHSVPLERNSRLIVTFLYSAAGGQGRLNLEWEVGLAELK